MKYTYYMALFCGAIFFAYTIGLHIGNIKCREKMANAIGENMITNTNIMEKTNEEVLHTATGDIRRILRQKYTIAE